MSGSGAGGLGMSGNLFGTSTNQQTGSQQVGTGGQFQMPNYMQPYANNLFGGNQQTNQPTQQQSQTNQPFGRNIYGYNMNRLSSMMDPSASLPQYQNPYQSNYSDTEFPQRNQQYQNYQYGLGDLLNLGYLFGQPNFFSPTPTPAPAPQTFGQTANQPSFDTSGLEKQIRDLQSQIEAMSKPKTSTSEVVADLGKGFEEQGVKPGTTASADTAAPAPVTPAPPPSALTSGAGFRDINTQFGGNLGNVNAVVNKNGTVTLVSNTNSNIKTTLPAGSYFDSKSGKIVNAQGQPINIGSQFISSSAPTALSTGIQFGDTSADIRREFGNAVNVTDKAVVNSDGSIKLASGTKIPANSYVDSSGVLRQPLRLLPLQQLHLRPHPHPHPHPLQRPLQNQLLKHRQLLQLKLRVCHRQKTPMARLGQLNHWQMQLVNQLSKAIKHTHLNQIWLKAAQLLSIMA
ncbi:MAG: hypothetical protein EBR82_39780 [Caulobacteraceae bacterium]|nr:hypothetical protein [Caulobacteraceae bacterium]